VIYLADHCVVVEEDSQNFRDEKERKMANRNLTIKLTNDQQKQIRVATGKVISELKVEVASGGQIAEKDLDKVVGGGTKKSSGGTTTLSPR
jgi:hypothetical protein